MKITSGQFKKEDARLISQQLKKIESRNGMITARMVVKAAASPKAPLHRFFNWNNDEAAENWRLHQARMMICHIHVKSQSMETSVRAFVNVGIAAEPEDGDDTDEAVLERGYVSIESTLNNVNLKAQVLNYAKQQLIMWKRKFGNYREFYGVAKAIEEMED